MKYEVRFSCGHTETVQLFGKNADRQRKIAWFEESGLCSKCYAEQKAAEMAEGCDAVEMFYGEYKEKYSDCKTKPGSYNRETKTIIVYVPKEEPTEEREAEIIKNRAREHMDRIKFHREELGLSDKIVRKVEGNLFVTLDKLEAKDIVRDKDLFGYDNILSVAKQAAFFEAELKNAEDDQKKCKGELTTQTKHGGTNYTRLMKYIEDMGEENSHKRYNDGGINLPLEFECLCCTDYKGRPIYSITHWGEMNGDAMRDPEITFSVDHESKTIEPQTYRNDYMGFYHEVYRQDDDGTWLYSNRLRIELDQHLYDWINMIEQSGFHLEK